MEKIKKLISEYEEKKMGWYQKQENLDPEIQSGMNQLEVDKAYISTIKIHKILYQAKIDTITQVIEDLKALL